MPTGDSDINEYELSSVNIMQSATFALLYTYYHMSTCILYICCIFAAVTAILDLNCLLVLWRVIHLGWSQFIIFVQPRGGGGAGRTKNHWLYGALEMEGHQYVVKTS